jgi:signal transduction histidine kinase
LTRNHRRKKYFIEESSQGKYLFSYLLLACLVMILFTLLFVYFSTDTLSIAYEDNQLKMGKTPEIMLKSIVSIHGIMIFVCGIAIVYFVTRFTHKTAGPLFKIGRALDMMTKGDLTSGIFLRKNDECRELADKVNLFNTVIREKLYEMGKLAGELDRCIDGLNHKADADIPVALPWDHLQSINGRLKRCLSFFRLPADEPKD